MSSSTIKGKLLPFFTTALKTFQLSNETFAVLCSLPASSTPATENGLRPSPPSQTARSLLVLDSSFNPPTTAHRRMVLSALSDMGNRSKEDEDEERQSRVLLLLAINNADKAPKPAAFPQRLSMMYVFAQDLMASQEALGNGTSGVDIAVTTEPYFHSKSAAVQESRFYSQTRGDGRQSDVGAGKGSASMHPEQIYLTGFDTLIRIFNPKYYPGETMASVLDPFFAHSSLRVTMRTDADWGGAGDQIEYLDGLRRGKLEEVGGRVEWADKIEMVEGRRDGEEIVSSTKVRDAVQRKDWGKLEGLVSKNVAGWVREEGLYEEDGEK